MTDSPSMLIPAGVSYDVETDRVIYGGQPLPDMEPDSYARLALALLDQAGVSLRVQGRVRELLVEEGVLVEDD